MLERADRLADRRRMMREVVDRLDPALFAAHFLPARDSLKALERLAHVCQRNPIEPRGRNRHRGVAHVEFAYERYLELVFAQDETRSIGRIGGLAKAPRAIR